VPVTLDVRRKIIMIEKLKNNDNDDWITADHILRSKINEIIDAINHIQRTLDIEFQLDGPNPIDINKL
jgi:ACT domain-containing protein